MTADSFGVMRCLKWLFERIRGKERCEWRAVGFAVEKRTCCPPTDPKQAHLPKANRRSAAMALPSRTILRTQHGVHTTRQVLKTESSTAQKEFWHSFSSFLTRSVILLSIDRGKASRMTKTAECSIRWPGVRARQAQALLTLKNPIDKQSHPRLD
jgi:hypothetical protein